MKKQLKLDKVFLLDNNIYQSLKLAESVKKSKKLAENIVEIKNEFNQLKFLDVYNSISKNSNCYTRFKAMCDNKNIVYTSLESDSKDFSELINLTNSIKGTFMGNFYFYWEKSTSIVPKLIIENSNNEKLLLIEHENNYKKYLKTMENTLDIKEKRKKLKQESKLFKIPNKFDQLFFEDELDTLYADTKNYSNMYYLGQGYTTYPSTLKTLATKTEKTHLFLIELPFDRNYKFYIHASKYLPKYVYTKNKEDKVTELLSNLDMKNIFDSFVERKENSSTGRLSVNSHITSLVSSSYLYHSFSDTKESSINKYSELIEEMSNFPNKFYRYKDALNSYINDNYYVTKFIKDTKDENSSLFYDIDSNKYNPLSKDISNYMY